MKHWIYYTMIAAMALLGTSCRDDFMTDVFIGEGEAEISATLDFKPMSSSLTRTRAAGDALKDISSLYVLLYDADGALVDKWEKNQLTSYEESEADRTDADAENGRPSAEAQTKRATFTLPGKIRFGRYYMYAVANIPGLLTEYYENIQTVDGLKSLPLTWDSSDISNNGQMIGHFTNAVSQSGDEMLTVNAKGVKLHAWLRRAASKVTIAYDGSELKEGVFVYLQSVQIKDMPVQCYLGKDNNVGGKEYNLRVTPEGEKFDTDETGTGTTMLDGEIHYYHEGDKPEGFEYGEACANHRVTVGAPHFGSHDEKADALYFYENMQGAGDHMPDKRQDADGNGELDRPGLPKPEYDKYELKDSVKYGTYVEVHAHYVSNNAERLGNGHIIYRFMLGQDVKKDYNAKRNCHYKLTLKFKNFANEADWHIEYEEPEPGVMVPEPYYISYLYNHSMMLPVKVSTGGYEIVSMKAKILDNRWAPYNAIPGVYYGPMDLENQNQWNGFLSLHETTKTLIESTQTGVTANESYYNTPPKRGEREYTNFDIGEHFCQCVPDRPVKTDKYRVEKDSAENNTYNVYLPMYTRAKQMIPATGYTGNNPYVAYQRKAVVQITTKLSNGIEYVNEVPIYQVRRIVNPKGIYRSGSNPSSFHVELMRLPGEDATDFVTFQSEGPWKAYIVRETNNGGGIYLSPSPDHGSVERPDKEYGTAIHGKTGSLIDFNVNFAPGGTGNRYAIIRVEYHNYTCQHLIFVRQGNAPDSLIAGGALWYAENMRTKKRASTPLDEGSLLRRGNWEDPIDALNNKNSRSPWVDVTAGDFVLHPVGGFTIAGKNEIKPWNQITVVNPSTATQGVNIGFDDPDDEMRVATYEDYNSLRTHEDIELGYGVLYGDDATECAVHIDEVYGYDYRNNMRGRGMRGCFVYNKVTGKNLFFPIGASGYGHRKNGENGILRYSGARTDFMSDRINERPLFYDLFKRPGAIYWLERQNGSVSGWDFNYFTFDFNSYPFGALGQNLDAGFVRCVKK